MNQRQMVSEFIDKNRPKFNPVFFQRDEDEIIRELMNVIYSCERENEYFTIKVDSYRVVENYDEVNRTLYNYYENLTKNKSKSKKRDNQYAYINLNDSDIRLLIIRYYLKDVRQEESYLDVIIAVPRIIDKYYFRINGIMRSTLFQIVDGSTYNNGTSNAKVPSVTLKIIFMALRVTRYYNTLKTTDGLDMKLTYYHSRIFNKGIAAAKYIFAKYGYYGGLKFLGVEGAIFLTPNGPEDEAMYTFKINDHAYVSSPRYLVDRVPLIQSLIVTLYDAVIDIPLELVFEDEYWVRSLGSEFSGGGNAHLLAFYNSEQEAQDSLEKGYSILSSFESIYDISTRESIRLPEEDKETTYHIIRWIMREFNALRIKDNLDIGCKRIRFAEYIASIYAMKIARGIYRVSDTGKKATISTICKAIRTDPNYLLTALVKSNMLSYRNMVSDEDSMQALKFTYKGVSGLGEGSNRSIPTIYRSIHPSHLGRVDLDSSSDGNPGITGTLCPYAETYNGFFQQYEEPNSWEQEFMLTMDEYKKACNLKDALIFQQKILGVDKSEEINQASAAIASMQQIIKPVIFADQGEIISLEDAYNGI